MLHPHDVLRARIYDQLGLADPPVRCADPKELWESEWSPTFERMRHDRMVVGTYRYGRASTYDGPDRLLPRRAIRRIELYIKTGNTEYLLDAANFLMIEFEWGTHPNKHLRVIHEGHDRSRL